MPRRRRLPAELPEFLTREEAAEVLHCSVDTIDRRIRDKRLKALVNGRLVRIAVSDLRAFIKASRTWR